MITETPLVDASIITLERHTDERGFLINLGLPIEIRQLVYTYNIHAGTLRGMHYQAVPCAQKKLIVCLQGALYDVIIDLRPQSPTYKQWYGIELSAVNGKALYIPEGFAHGFQTLEDNTALLYQLSAGHSPQHERGVRWNDPQFGIIWPLPVSIIKKRDNEFSDFV